MRLGDRPTFAHTLLGLSHDDPASPLLDYLAKQFGADCVLVPAIAGSPDLTFKLSNALMFASHTPIAVSNQMLFVGAIAIAVSNTPIVLSHGTRFVRAIAILSSYTPISGSNQMLFVGAIALCQVAKGSLLLVSLGQRQALKC